MARLPYVDPETACEPVREVFAALPVHLNIFKLMANAETCFRPLLGLGTAILGRQKLDGRLRELAILRVARLTGAEYEWVQHVPIAKAAGANDAQVAALERDDPADVAFDATERAVLDFATELVRDFTPSDATFATLSEHLSPQEVVELVLTTGFYITVAQLMNTAQIDLEPAADTKIVDALR